MKILNSFRKNYIDLNNKTITSPAGFFRRLAAGMIDFAIILLLVYVGKKITFFKAPGLENMYTIYYLALLSAYQTTIGGKILKIYTIKNNGCKLSILKSVLKSIVSFCFVLAGIFTLTINDFITRDGVSISILTISIIIGFVLLIFLPRIFTKSKRSFIDILSGTKVIYVSQT
jgi:uncharacterized RDD family membrane protein YckC